MKLPKNCKIELAASKNKIRPSIGAPYLEIRESGSRVCATNGAILAVIPVETEEGETSGYLSIDALKAARKTRDEHAEIYCNGSLQVKNGATFPRHGEEMRFPDVDAVTVPPNEEIHGCKRVKLLIDTVLLSSLADAIGSECVTLWLQAEEGRDGLVVDRPIRVEPMSDGRARPPACRDAFGVIMPIRP